MRDISTLAAVVLTITAYSLSALAIPASAHVLSKAATVAPKSVTRLEIRKSAMTEVWLSLVLLAAEPAPIPSPLIPRMPDQRRPNRC